MSLVRGSSILILSIASFGVWAQESVTQETNAPYIKWYQLNTTNFRILYPKGFDAQAQRVANTLETIREPEAKSMGVLPKKISVILQNQSSLSNGFVTLAPKRSEFYTMPSQNYNFAGNNDWLNLLSSHEYRHMVQFQRSITGFNKAVWYVFGQRAVAGLGFAAAPQWFWEGDAVATETAFTKSGRGRIPNFDMLFRTNIMEGRTFNYHKQYLRSYKNNIPNHYVLGYNMVSYLRKKTGDPLIWEKVTGRSWRWPFIPFAFSNALKKETGMYVKDLYEEMASERKKDYEKAVSELKLTSFESITRRKSTAYTDYFFPQELENGKILVTKSGIGDIEQLVVLSPDGKEEDRYVQGVINDAGMLSASNQRVVWNEFRYDPRWLVHTYSVIKGYDFGTGESKVISRQSRYSGAALSPDGYRVATVETTPDYKIQLVILDYFSGKILGTLPNPDNDLLAMPRWTPDGKSVVTLRTNAKGKTITRFEIAQGISTDLIPFSEENIGYPVPFQNLVLYNSPFSGIDNIYAVNVDTGERLQVTSSKYGAYNPSLSRDGKTIFYNDQTRDGLDVVKMPFDPAGWKKVEAAPISSNSLYQHLVEQEANPNLLQNIPQTQYRSKRYRRAQGMINPHSWGPYFTNSLTSVSLGISSQDILSTTSLDAGYVYDINERTGSWQASASYQGFYPILDVKVAQSNRSVNEGDINTYVITGVDTTILTRNLTFQWQEQTAEAGLRVPLVTTTSKFIGNFSFGNSVGVTHVYNFRNSINDLRYVPAVVKDGKNILYYPFFNYVGNGNLIYNHFSMSGYRLLKQSRRDIYSKWGQSFFMDYYNTPYGGDYSGGQFSIYGVGYFPGLMKHHSIWGYYAYENSQIPRVSLATGQGLDTYTFRNQIPLPRGQAVSRFQNFYSMSVNYTLPLWYPDIALGPLVNFQRLRANVFYDYGYGNSPDFGASRKYISIGTEVKVDINVMRFLPQFNVGFRYSYGLQPSVTSFELLIGSFNL
jgi:hypothetical protein